MFAPGAIGTITVDSQTSRRMAELQMEIVRNSRRQRRSSRYALARSSRRAELLPERPGLEALYQRGNLLDRCYLERPFGSSVRECSRIARAGLYVIQRPRPGPAR